MSKLHQYLVVILVAIVAIVWVVVFRQLLPMMIAPAPVQTSPQVTSIFTIRDGVVRAEVVSRPEDIEKGLSGRAGLAKDSGMFFDFGKSSFYGIWMPDMHFSIDVLWFDETMRVVYIVEAMSPESYPKVFMPTSPARYVLEVPDGFVKSHGIRVGDRGEFAIEEKAL